MADLNDRTVNVSIHDDTSESAVTTSAGAGGKRLLDVAAAITDNDSPTKFQLKTDYDATGDLLTSAADVILFQFTGTGVIDFVGVSNSTSSSYEVAIYIDGTERFRSTMADLGSLGMTASGVPFWTQTANKEFRWHPRTEVGFTTSFKVVARATGANTTVTHMTTFREKVVT